MRRERRRRGGEPESADGRRGVWRAGTVLVMREGAERIEDGYVWLNRVNPRLLKRLPSAAVSRSRR